MELLTFLKLVTLIRTLPSQSCDAAWAGSEEQGEDVGQATCDPLGLCRAALAFREGRAERGILVKLQLLMDVLALA